MTHFLVTGASGLLGLNFALAVDGKVHQVTGVANTAPMLVLGTALLYGYLKAARIVLPIVYLPTSSAGTAKPSRCG